MRPSCYQGGPGGRLRSRKGGIFVGWALFKRDKMGAIIENRKDLLAKDISMKNWPLKFNFVGKERVISGAVMLLLLAIAFWFGPKALGSLLLIIYALFLDELWSSFAQQKRWCKDYWAIMFGHLFLLFYCGLYGEFTFIHKFFLLAALMINGVWLIYLFAFPLNRQKLVNLWKAHPVILSWFYLPAFISWGTLCQAGKAPFLGAVFLLVILVDTGAWFVGKRWGKRPLWPSVSPHKTWEGLLGGVVIGTLGLIIYTLIFKEVKLPILGLIVLALAAQAGDLVESKIKRQFKLKDSSNLIPGHGGVYDRLDGLIFVVPFFIGLAL